MSPNPQEFDLLGYYLSTVGPYPLTGEGHCPVDVFNPLWYSQIQGWSALYHGDDALVLIMAPEATHQIMSTSGILQLLTRQAAKSFKRAVQVQQGLPRLPDMGVRQGPPNPQRLFTG